MQTRLSCVVVSWVFQPVLFLSVRHVDDGCERSAGVSFKDYDLVFSSTTSEGLKKYDPRILSLVVGVLKLRWMNVTGQQTDRTVDGW